MENIIKRQSNKKRPVPEKAMKLKDKRKLRRSLPKTTYGFSVKLTKDEIDVSGQQAKFLKEHLGIMKSEALRRFLLNLTNKNILNELGFKIDKKY